MPAAAVHNRSSPRLSLVFPVILLRTRPLGDLNVTDNKEDGLVEDPILVVGGVPVTIPLPPPPQHHYCYHRRTTTRQRRAHLWLRRTAAWYCCTQASNPGFRPCSKLPPKAKEGETVAEPPRHLFPLRPNVQPWPYRTTRHHTSLPKDPKDDEDATRRPQ